MKTTTIILGLLTTTLAFAAPAAAECASIDATGAFVCADVAGPNSYNVAVVQPGVGSASTDAYEFSFFGQTYRGRNAFVAVEGVGSAQFNEFCMAGPDGCTYQDDSVMAFTPAGIVYASLWKGTEGRTLCVAAGDQFACEPLP